MTAASDTIRASINALPEAERKPWVYHDDSAVIPPPQQVQVLLLGDGRMVEAVGGGDALSPSEARHIALLASPDVATALADLLDAVATGDRFPLYRWQERVDTARDALENTILRRPT